MKWIQNDDILQFIDGNVEIKFRVPIEFNIDKVHPDTLMLAEFFLLYPLKKNMFDDYQFTRRSTGNNIGLAFSGGVDSTASMLLYDDYEKLIPFHIEREWLEQGKIEQESNHIMIKKMGDDIMVTGYPGK